MREISKLKLLNNAKHEDLSARKDKERTDLRDNLEERKRKRKMLLTKNPSKLLMMKLLRMLQRREKVEREATEMAKNDTH